MADSSTNDPKDQKGTPAADTSQKDPTPYIRTYAEDVARLTHQPLPQSKPRPNDDSDGVALPDIDESPVNRPGGIIRDVPQEQFVISKEDSDGVFAQANATAAAPATRPSPFPRPSSPPRMPPPPSRPQPAPVAPPPPMTEAQRRDEILTRLRQRVAGGPPTPPAPKPPSVQARPPAPPPTFSVPPPPPVSVPVPPAPVVPPPPPRSRPYVPPPVRLFVPPPPRQLTSPPQPAPPPDFRPPAPPPAPPPVTPPVQPPPPPAQPAQPPFIPPAPPAPAVRPMPPPPPGVIQPQRPSQAGPSPFHSYTTDFADRIETQQASSFTVLAAEQDARSGSPTSSRKRSGVVPAILAFVLIVGGAGGLYAAYRYVSTDSATEETLGVPSLIFADEKMELSGPDYRQDLADAAGQPLVEGNILVTYITSASSTPLGVRAAPQPGGALIRQLNLGAPDILLRNVDLMSTVGIVNAGGETRPFFVLRVNSYERTFAGMLGWESRMLGDLDPLYPSYGDSTPQQTATTTSTSTSPIPPITSSAPREFVDSVVANYDVRVLKDAAGRTLVIYGYTDKQTLLIARDEAAFTTLAARLAATRSQ